MLVVIAGKRRTHVCPHCGYMADHDCNAALDILAAALNTVGHTGMNVCGEKTSVVKR